VPTTPFLVPTAEPTVRHEQYEAYKANRPEFPEDLVPQLLRIKELLTALRIPILEMPGYEADDIIGSLAKKAAAHGLEVYCVTSDKDFFQLVNAHIKIFRPGIRSGEYEIIDGTKVRQRYGIVERFRLQKPDYAQLHTLFDQLGFHRLRERFGLPDAETAIQETDFQTIADRPHQYTLVNSFALLQEMLTELQQTEWLAVDTETSGTFPSSALNATLLTIDGE